MQRSPKRSGYREISHQVVKMDGKNSSYECLNLENPVLKLYSIKDPVLRYATDELYLNHQEIPHLELLLVDFKELLIAKQQFEAFLGEKERQLPSSHHHYIAIIVFLTQIGCCHSWLSVCLEQSCEPVFV